MTIKPGTLCIVRAPASQLDYAIEAHGKTVLAVAEDGRAPSYWVISPPVRLCLKCGGIDPKGVRIPPGAYWCKALPAHWLIPISDPDQSLSTEDAKDSERLLEGVGT